jgi:putative addiction module component (TIGR02574 family)
VSPAAEDIKKKLSALPPEDRAEIAYFLIHTLDEQTDPDWDACWHAELTRRTREIECREVVGQPADEVFRELRKKYS